VIGRFNALSVLTVLATLLIGIANFALVDVAVPPVRLTLFLAVTRVASVSNRFATRSPRVSLGKYFVGWAVVIFLVLVEVIGRLNKLSVLTVLLTPLIGMAIFAVVDVAVPPVRLTLFLAVIDIASVSNRFATLSSQVSLVKYFVGWVVVAILVPVALIGELNVL